MHWYGLIHVLHMLVAAVWVGAGILLTVFLLPSLRQLGQVGVPVTVDLLRRRMGKFMASIGGLTVLTGLWLYWQFTHGFDAVIIRSGPGLMLGVAGLLGIVAAFVGGAMIGRTIERIAYLGEQLPTIEDVNQKAAHLEQIARLRHRAALASRCDAALLIIVFVLMAMSHYV